MPSEMHHCAPRVVGRLVQQQDEKEVESSALVEILVDTDQFAHSREDLLQSTSMYCRHRSPHDGSKLRGRGAVGLSQRTRTGESEQVPRDEERRGLAGGLARNRPLLSEDSDVDETVQGCQGGLARDLKFVGEYP